MTKEMHGFKPGGRRNDKCAVEGPSSRHGDKLEIEASKIVNSGKESGSVHRQEKGSWQVLPERQTRISTQDKLVSRFGQGPIENRPRGLEKLASKPKSDLASRFEDKFPAWQTTSYDKRQPTREDAVEKWQKWPNGVQEKPGARSKMLNRTNRESHDRPEFATETRSTRHQQEALDQLHKRHPHLQELKEAREREKSTKKHQPKRTKGYIEETERPQKPHEKSNEKFDGAQDQPKTHTQERHEKVPRLIHKSHILDKTFVISEKSSYPQTSPQTIRDDWNILEPTLRHTQETQRQQISSQSHRHQPHIREPDERQRQLYERPTSAHEHETKLIQRQKYLQDKVRSRKMLLGSVISSDMTFLSEACRNWQSTTMLSRYKEQKSWNKQSVLSADSGCSMGEGSCASRRNSETETDDQLRDEIPTIIADVGETVHHRFPSKCLKCQRMRSEMKDASSQHSHPPSEMESPPSSPYTESLASGSVESTALNVMFPPPPDRIYQCRVVRDKDTYGTMFYPVYRMYLEVDGRPEVLLLTARKRKKCSTSKYLICTGKDELRRKSASLVGKLRSNLVGTRFHLATYVKGSDLEEDDDSRPESPEPLKFDSLLLFYETNFLGTKGPRRMKVFLPRAADQELNLLNRVRDGSLEDVLTLVNKEPEWDRETLSHILYFEGRVTKSSVKNFQLVQPPDESVLLQFGKIGRNEFTLDYQTPMNAVQAFAIALSSFDGKIACE